MFGKLWIAVAILPSVLHAGRIDVMVQGISVSATLGTFQDASNLQSGLCASFAPDYPCEGSNQDGVNPTVNGFNTASVLTSTSASSGSGAVTPSSADSFASVSATQGHVGMSFSAEATGLGEAVASGTAIWNDILTVGGLAPGTPVTLLASLTLDVAYTGGGYSGGHLNTCFGNSLFLLCSTFDDDFEGNVTRPGSPTAQFTVHSGDILDLGGRADGFATAANYLNAGPSSGFELVATNSAHYTIVSLTPGVDLTLASGCSITNGLGCDSPRLSSSVPEPGGWPLAGTGLFALAILARLRRARRGNRVRV